ncbi:MAG: peptidoglycan recognition family protein [Chloroflexia bacterium]
MRKYASLVFCLLFLLSASSAGAIASARPAAGPSARTYAENWKETFVQRQGKVATALDGGKTVQVYTSLPHAAKVRFTAMAPHWEASVPAGASLQVFVRKSVDGKTGRWLLAEPNRRSRPGRCGPAFGMLVTGDPAGYGQYKVVSSPSPRGEQPRVSDVTLTFIDASQGPTTAQARASASASAGLEASAVSRPAVVSRAGWGADESLRFDADGQEIWPKEYLQVTKAVLHDTITANNDPNPARTMRSIYYYHAVTRGWGDIGYNYLIDEQGDIYEGRVGGENSVAGHVRCYNFGTVGIAALGDHAKVRPSEAMMTSFKKIIAWHFDRAGINPHGRGIFMKNNIEPLAVQNNIMAHVDASRSSFTCGNTHVDPGPYIYNRLGEIRDSVATIMGYTPTPKPVITDVTFAPTRLNQGRTLRVEVRLINTGTGLMETQAPYPGFVYQAGQDWSDLAFDKVDASTGWSLTPRLTRLVTPAHIAGASGPLCCRVRAT